MKPPQAGGGFYLKIKRVNSSRLKDRFKSPLERVSRRGGDVRARTPVHRDFGEVGHATCGTVDGQEVNIAIPEAGGQFHHYFYPNYVADYVAICISRPI